MSRKSSRFTLSTLSLNAQKARVGEEGADAGSTTSVANVAMGGASKVGCVGIRFASFIAVFSNVGNKESRTV